MRKNTNALKTPLPSAIKLEKNKQKEKKQVSKEPTTKAKLKAETKAIAAKDNKPVKNKTAEAETDLPSEDAIKEPAKKEKTPSKNTTKKATKESTTTKTTIKKVAATTEKSISKITKKKEDKLPLSDKAVTTKDIEPDTIQEPEKEIEKQVLIVPDSLKEYINVVDCSDFDTEKYYLTDQVFEIRDSILKTKEKSDIIQNIIGMAYPNTTLLYGPPGTGKTSLCKYLAHEFNIPFVYLNFAKIFNGVFGRTSMVLSEAFDFISSIECIFCLDEVDCISQRRGTESDVTGGEISRVTITLMQCIDGLRNKKSNAIIIGCTNRVDIMDEALRSRFSVEREVKNLSVAEKKDYIEKFIKQVDMKLLAEGMEIIRADKDNIEAYCNRAFSLSQRDVEMDLIRCIALWLDDPTKKLDLNHITNY